METMDLKIDELIAFTKHPFKPYEGQRFTDMVESIKANGVHTPIVVRPLAGGKYEILSGHNRVAAAKEANLQSIPAVIRDNLTDDEALLIVTETNLLQRSLADLSHSEKALAIATHYEAMKKKSGYRTDLLKEIDELSSAPVGRRSGTRDKLGEQYGMGKNTIARYLRVSKLVPTLQDKLDKGKIGMRVAEALSYLQKKEQEILSSILTDDKAISIKQAYSLRDESDKAAKEKRVLNKAAIEKILEPVETTVTIKPLNLSSDLLSKYFDKNESQDEIESILAQALEQYYANKTEIE